MILSGAWGFTFSILSQKCNWSRCGAPLTSEAALAKACSLTKRLGKVSTCRTMTDRDFSVNRILSRYLAEAVILVRKGISFRRIDTVAKNFGMAVDSGTCQWGPLELLDLVGLPVGRARVDFSRRLGPRIESRDVLLRNFFQRGNRP